MARLRVAVVMGGRSSEHEVSVASAQSVLDALDPARYETVTVEIGQDGRWELGPGSRAELERDGRSAVETLPVPTSRVPETLAGVDVVFPVLHGPFGEDGTVQGLLELANVPYVGAGVLGSAVGMDKAVMKTLFTAHGLPIVSHITVMRRDWEREAASITEHVSGHLRYPVFVKPANLGSSVGISRARTDHELAEAMTLALQFDKKVVIEAGVPSAREIECAVLGNDDPKASIPGEIIVTHRDGFYSYAAKYLDPSGAITKIPASLSPLLAERVRSVSIQAFRVLELAGMARVDFFVDGKTDELFLNEVNTIPGFTSISMYPKMWEASGLPYPALLERLLDLALERHAEKQRLHTSIT
jgi:D-alanine-D-alanine ligase